MHTYTRVYVRAYAYAYIYGADLEDVRVVACAGAVGSPGRSALRETTSLLPVVAGGYFRPAFLMQGSAGHFDPIHAYVSIMLTPIR